MIRPRPIHREGSRIEVSARRDGRAGDAHRRRHAAPARRWAALGLALGMSAVLTGCSSSMAWLGGEPPPDDNALPPAVSPSLVGRGEWHGALSRAQSTTYLVARNAAEWQSLWDLVGMRIPGTLPERLMALGVFLGSRNSSGAGVEVVNTRVEHREGMRDRLVVEYHEFDQSSRNTATGSLTSPYAIVLVDWSDAPVRFARVP
ncbi:hypothetical protein [Nitrospirillum sp. BR 11163]|uniref:hypothetical protein n=1 Tax=Nitrospirillum sp. BR 11163 TaxID=3104323 RepID=UPI002AFE09FF|nr:hypothetical protein [Nitrospirillum sp. BR 11163]MEA1676640.1 hypothetical protein [Nitrospirillum sp. BR 11163]